MGSHDDRLAMFHLRHRLPERYDDLKAPGRGAKSARTLAREEADAADAALEKEEYRHDAVIGHWRDRVTRMHETWRKLLYEDPAKAAAYELLFGVNESEFVGGGPGFRIIRFPPEVALALFDLLYPDPEHLAAAGRVLPGRDHLAFASARAGVTWLPGVTEQDVGDPEPG